MKEKYHKKYCPRHLKKIRKSCFKFHGHFIPQNFLSKLPKETYSIQFFTYNRRILCTALKVNLLYGSLPVSAEQALLVFNFILALYGGSLSATVFGRFWKKR